MSDETQTPVQNAQMDEAFLNAVGFDLMDEKEQEEFLSRLGETIVESMMLRVVADMTDEEAEAFEKYVATDPEPEAMMQHLKEIRPDIDTLFKEEAEAYKEETKEIFTRIEGTT